MKSLLQKIIRIVFVTRIYTNNYNNTLFEQLVICGAMTQMCIDTTTRAAFDLGYQCIVIADACATKDLSIQDTPVSEQHVQTAYMAGLRDIFKRYVI